MRLFLLRHNINYYLCRINLISETAKAMKKKFLAILMILSPLVSMAQNNWVIPEAKKPAKTEKTVKTKNVSNKNERDLPYLAGAVPEKDGEVVFSREIDTNGMTAEQAFDAVYNKLEQLTTGEKQTERSKIAIFNKEQHSIVATFYEWLVFSDKLLVLDRALFNYMLVADCSNGKVNITISRLAYEYGTDGDKERFDAEGLITDRLMIAKDGKKLKKVNRKFRVGTVDRMNEVLDSIQSVFGGNANTTK